MASNAPFQKYDKKLFIFPNKIQKIIYPVAPPVLRIRDVFWIPDPGVKKAEDPGSATLGTTTEKLIRFYLYLPE